MIVRHSEGARLMGREGTGATSKGLRELPGRSSKKRVREGGTLTSTNYSITVARARIIDTLCFVVQLFTCGCLSPASFDMRITIITRKRKTPNVNIQNVQVPRFVLSVVCLF